MVEENKKKRGKKGKVMVVIIILLSLILIALGVYLWYLSTPMKIMASSIDQLNGKILEIINTNKDTYIGDTYTLESNIAFDINSDYATSLATTDPENYGPIAKLLQNLSNTKVKINMAQDKENKKLLLNYNATLNNQELISGKNLIQNATQYYYVNGVSNNYINNGTSNYFESLNQDTTSKENYMYIEAIIVKSLKENLKEEYFIKSQEKTTINDKEEKVTKVSLKLDDKRIRTIAKAILKDLKSDEKANKILTDLNEDFSKAKIKDDTEILGTGNYITLNIYTDNIMYQPKKYELIYTEKEKEDKIVYELGQEKDTAYIIEEEKIMYILEIVKKENKYKVNVLESPSKEEIGKLELDISDKRTTLSLSMKEETTKVELNYDLKLQNVKPNKSYNSTIVIELKVVSDQMNIVNTKINAENSMKKGAEINEDVSNSILANSMTEEEKQLLENKQMNVIMQLQS